MNNEANKTAENRVCSCGWPILAWALVAIQAAFAIMVGTGAGGSRVSNDGILHVLLFLLLLLGAGVSTLNAIRCRQAIRLFWSFCSSFCMLWALNAWSWIYYVAVLRKHHPAYLFASVPLFQQPIFLIAAVASHHSEKPRRLSVQAGRMYAYEWDAASDTVIRFPECVDILGSHQLLETSRRETRRWFIQTNASCMRHPSAGLRLKNLHLASATDSCLPMAAWCSWR